ncbi:MAG: hypothetical protein WD060_00020 [Pirellulales bacterium]
MMPTCSGKALLKVDRAGHAGEVAVAVGPSPDGITVRAEPIPGDSTSGMIVVTVSERLGDTEVVAALPVTVTLEGMTAQQTLTVKVPKLAPPAFAQDGLVVLQPGMTGTATLRIDRKGYKGQPLEVRAVEESAGITWSVEAIGREEDVATITLSVATEAEDGVRTIPLEASTLGRKFPTTLDVRILARPYRVDALRAVVLAPGESKTVELPVTRPAYAGPIDVSADGLPEGVTMEPVSVAAGGEQAVVVFRSAADAESQVRSATIRTAGGGFAAHEPIVIRIRKAGDEASLPAAVLGSPEVMQLMRRGSIGGRLTAASKRALSELYGGTTECEAAVARGLAWLARNQQPDGSWAVRGAGVAPSADRPPDEEPQNNVTAATALGILPFLGEGITHQRTPKEPVNFQFYKPVVEKGLVFLARHQVRAKGDADGFFGGSTSAHSLATIAFCEAYGLSRDERAKFNAKQGIKYLLTIQDNFGGGWCDKPREPGNLSVTGWVIIALRSGQLAGLSVSTKQLQLAERFVDSVAAGPDGSRGSRYCSTAGRPASDGMTAAGLLARLYLGWDKDEADLQAGRDSLMAHRPPLSADTLGPLSYYYDATQVLHHLEGDDFDVWNHLMREHLLRLQRTSGDLAGSWNPRGDDGDRLDATAIALLTLQVYYRHLPMYRDVKRSPTDSPSADKDADRAADAGPQSGLGGE